MKFERDTFGSAVLRKIPFNESKAGDDRTAEHVSQSIFDCFGKLLGNETCDGADESA